MGLSKAMWGYVVRLMAPQVFILRVYGVFILRVHESCGTRAGNACVCTVLEFYSFRYLFYGLPSRAGLVREPMVFILRAFI